MDETAEKTSPANGGGAFHTTHWTVVLEAASPGAVGANEAFARLYRDYWYPLHAYVRRRGYSPHDAEDIAQGFFARLLEKQALAGVTREGGRFRTFLLTALSHFLANLWDRSRAQKRGHGVPTLSLETDDAEARYGIAAAEGDAPDTLFEKSWALTLLEHVFDLLRAECAATGRAGLFDDLRLHLQGDRQGPPYAEIAARHGLKETSIKVTVHRWRQRYGELLREEIARTVSRPQEVEDELRHLISVVSR